MWKETSSLNNPNNSIINREIMEGSDITSNCEVFPELDLVGKSGYGQAT